MADADFSVKAIISAQTAQFEKGMKNAQSSVNSMSKSIENVQKLLKTAFSIVGITMGTKAILDFGKTCTQAANQATKQFNILDNTVRATGADAWTSTEELENMAKSLSNSTSYSVTEIEKMQSVLLGFRNITTETFEDASEAILDMSTVMGMDLTSAVQTVGKALDDPIKGLDSLRRQGFAFTDEQKEELKALVDSGKQIEAQKIILDELATTYGGAAKAGQDAFAKQRHSAENFTETIGGKLLPTMQLIAKSNAKLLDNLAKFISKLDFSQIESFIEQSQKLFDDFGSQISDAFENNIDEDTIYNALNFVYKALQIVLNSITAIIHGDWEAVWDYAELVVVNIVLGISKALGKMVDDLGLKVNLAAGIIGGLATGFGLLTGNLAVAAAGVGVAVGGILATNKQLMSNMNSELEKEVEDINKRLEQKTKDAADKTTNYVLEDLEKVDKKTKDTGNKTKTNLVDPIKNMTTGFDAFRKGVHKALTNIGKDYEGLKTKTEQFNKLLENMGMIMTESVISSFKTFFTTLGEELAQNSVSWQSMTAVALEGIAEVLSALGSQLIALAAVAASQERYHDAAIATAGAAAAFVASGAISAIASQMKEAADEANNIVASINTLVQKLNEIKNQASFESMYSDLSNLTTLLNTAMSTREFAKMSAQMWQANRNVFLAWKYGQKYWKLFKQADVEVQLIENTIRSYYKTVQNNLQAVNEEIKNQIEYYDKLYSITNDIIEIGEGGIFGSFELESSFQKYKIMIQQQTNSIKESVLSVFNEFSTIGTTIGENIVDGIIDGTTKQDFASQLKSYLRENMIKLAVYTDEFSEKLGQSSTNFIIALNTKNADLLATTRKELEALWDGAKSAASEAESFIDSVFGDIQENVESVIESAEEMGSSIADSLIDGLSNGLSQADFLETMKSYIKKLVVTSVVYTESLQAEIAAIGEAISNGIKEGFSETGLDEIRRDLSYIWYNANNAVSAIDSVLNNVFTGYATGTDNATAGLHLVGEAGPELVRFRGGEQVYNANETRDMLQSGNGGNNFNVTFNNMQDTSAFTMLQQMKQWQRDMAINGII